VLASQGGYGGGAACGPVHAGLFEACAEDGFAAGFHDAGADEHAEFSVVGVAHAVGVGLEVGDGFVDQLGLRAGQVVEAGSAGDRVDVAVVQLVEPLVQPLGWVGDDEVEQAGEFVQVFAGVEQVHDLGGCGEALLGQVPDPAGPVAQDHELAQVFAAAASGFGGEQVSEVLDRFQGGQVAGGVGVPDRAAVGVGCRSG
jgi:hypothetical protein